MAKVHFTRDWKGLLCAPHLATEGHMVTSCPKLLGSWDAFNQADVCCNCSRKLTDDEQRQRRAKAEEMARLRMPRSHAR
jgi:hypothetical protein